MPALNGSSQRLEHNDLLGRGLFQAARPPDVQQTATARHAFVSAANEIGTNAEQPAVLELKVLQALHLLGLQPAELLAPPTTIRYLAHPDLADCIHHILALRDQNIDLTTISSGLYRFVVGYGEGKTSADLCGLLDWL